MSSLKTIWLTLTKHIPTLFYSVMVLGALVTALWWLVDTQVSAQVSTAIEKELPPLEKRVHKNEKAIHDIKKDIGEIRSDIGEVKTHITLLNEKYDALNEKYTSLSQDTSWIRGFLQNLDKRLLAQEQQRNAHKQSRPTSVFPFGDDLEVTGEGAPVWTIPLPPPQPRRDTTLQFYPPSSDLSPSTISTKPTK